MNLRKLFPNVLIVVLSITLVYCFFDDPVFGQIDIGNEIEFLQTGKLITNEKEFLISNEITIREFFNGNIIRVSGLTADGHPYITYTKIINEELFSHGLIYKEGIVLKINFEKQEKSEKQIQKNNDLLILSKFIDRVYNKDLAKIDIKVFDIYQNKLNDYNQNYGLIAKAEINIRILDEQGKVFASFDGMTNERGFYHAEFLIPDNQPKETLIAHITVQNEISKSSKILEIFNLGQEPDDGSSS